MKKFKKIVSIILLVLVWNQSVFAMKSWSFKVFYGEQEIGEHNFTLEGKGDVRKVVVDAEFNIDFLFMNVYSYKHKNIEVWKGACLSSIKSSTDDNGKKFNVSGIADDKIFKVDSKHTVTEKDGCVSSFAYWDMKFLDNDSLLNAQTGEIVTVDIRFVTNEKISVRNKMVNTKRYEVRTDDFNIDLWYSDTGEWVALNSTTQDGTTLRYQMK